MRASDRKAIEELRIERDYYRSVLKQIAEQKFRDLVGMANQAFDEYSPLMWEDMGRKFPWENRK